MIASAIKVLITKSIGQKIVCGGRALRASTIVVVFRLSLICYLSGHVVVSPLKMRGKPLPLALLFLLLLLLLRHFAVLK